MITLTVKDPSNNSATDTMWVNVTGIDIDNDGLTDYDEEHIYGTDLNNPDTDNDGINDGDEVAAGTDPLVAEPFDTGPGGKDIFSEYWWLFVLMAVLIIAVIMAFLLAKRKKGEPEELPPVTPSQPNTPQVDRIHQSPVQPPQQPPTQPPLPPPPPPR